MFNASVLSWMKFRVELNCFGLEWRCVAILNGMICFMIFFCLYIADSCFKLFHPNSLLCKAWVTFIISLYFRKARLGNSGQLCKEVTYVKRAPIGIWYIDKRRNVRAVFFCLEKKAIL